MTNKLIGSDEPIVLDVTSEGVENVKDTTQIRLALVGLPARVAMARLITEIEAADIPTTGEATVHKTSAMDWTGVRCMTVHEEIFALPNYQLPEAKLNIHPNRESWRGRGKKKKPNNRRNK